MMESVESKSWIAGLIALEEIAAFVDLVEGSGGGGGGGSCLTVAHSINPPISRLISSCSAFKVNPFNALPSLPSGEVRFPSPPKIVKSRQVVSSNLKNSKNDTALIFGYWLRKVAFRICRHQACLIRALSCSAWKRGIKLGSLGGSITIPATWIAAPLSVMIMGLPPVDCWVGSPPVPPPQNIS